MNRNTSPRTSTWRRKDDWTPEQLAILEERAAFTGHAALKDAPWGKHHRDAGRFILEYGYLTQPRQSRIVVLLQNAWISYPLALYDYLGCWPREDWLWVTSRSRTGERLRSLLCGNDDVYRQDVWFDNATPEVAIGDSRIRHPIDDEYVRGVLAAIRPEVVVACGVNAVVAAKRHWTGRVIETCHPAYRLVTNELFHAINEALALDEFRRISIVQWKGCVVVTDVP